LNRSVRETRMTSITKLPSDVGPIHFIGIGGIGMSGIAEVLLNYGFAVQGSDLKSSKITDRLMSCGARIFEGHDSRNLDGVDVVVASTAIRSDNPEIMAARALNLPIVKRSEMLAELMRLKSNIAIAGTHGKTTTTTLVATLLDAGRFDPTVINGGIIHAYGSNARMGQGEWMVVEADESDGSFNRLPATIAVVTNIDPEHLDHWGSIAALHEGFQSFVSNIPFYGLIVCCIDDPDVRALVRQIKDRRVVTYGLHQDADVCALNVRYRNAESVFDILFRSDDELLADCSLPMPGDYNVTNALAAVSVADHLGMDRGKIRAALKRFNGVNRRFTQIGVVDGITIVDDYGHHPVEIRAALSAARQVSQGRVIAVHQPHRYSRLSSLFDEFCRCFDEADVVAISDVYSAGEDPIPGATRCDLVRSLIAHNHPCAVSVSGEEDILALIRSQVRAGDIVMFLGAGTISNWAYSVFRRLDKDSVTGPEPSDILASMDSL